MGDRCSISNLTSSFLTHVMNQARPSRAGCPGLCPHSFATYQRMETPQLLCWTPFQYKTTWQKKKNSVFWCPGGFSCFSLCPLPYTLKASRPWRQWDLTLHSKVKIQMRKRTLENASHCHYAKYEVRSMSQNWSLDCLYDADSQFVILGQNPSYVLIRAMGHLLPAWICPSSSSNLTRFQAFFQVCWALLAFSKLYQDWIIN